MSNCSFLMARCWVAIVLGYWNLIFSLDPPHMRWHRDQRKSITLVLPALFLSRVHFFADVSARETSCYYTTMEGMRHTHFRMSDSPSYPGHPMLNLIPATDAIRNNFDKYPKAMPYLKAK